MAGIAGETIGLGDGSRQPPIGEYVQDEINPSGNNNYLGVNTGIAWETNVIAEDNVAGFVSPINNDTVVGLANWVQAGDEIDFEGLCTIADGVVTADGSGLSQCLVADGVVAGQWLWAIVVPV